MRHIEIELCIKFFLQNSQKSCKEKNALKINSPLIFKTVTNFFSKHSECRAFWGNWYCKNHKLPIHPHTGEPLTVYWMHTPDPDVFLRKNFVDLSLK